MDVAIACLALAGSIILVVVTLTLFFKAFEWAGRSIQRAIKPSLPQRYSLGDVLDPERPVTIHLVDGRVLKDARYLGALPDEFAKTGAVPYDLASMVLIGNPDGSRSLIRPKSIKSIEIPETDGSRGSGLS